MSRGLTTASHKVLWGPDIQGPVWLRTSTQESQAGPQCPEQQQEKDPDRALTEHCVAVMLDNMTLCGLSMPHRVEFYPKHPEAGLGGCVRVRSPG